MSCSRENIFTFIAVFLRPSEIALTSNAQPIQIYLPERRQHYSVVELAKCGITGARECDRTGVVQRELGRAALRGGSAGPLVGLPRGQPFAEQTVDPVTGEITPT